jgi:hypothetical protein
LTSVRGRATFKTFSSLLGFPFMPVIFSIVDVSVSLIGSAACASLAAIANSIAVASTAAEQYVLDLMMTSQGIT